MQQEDIEICVNISGVRRNIDSIDREIVALIAKRGAYVKQAAHFKLSTLDVEAPKRVEQVIEKVTTLAYSTGANIDVVQAVWRAMIHSFIEAEKKEFYEKSVN